MSVARHVGGWYHSGMQTIPLSQNKVAIIDDEDFRWISQTKWFCHHGNAETKRTIGGRRVIISMAREIMKCPEGRVVDHINGDKLDNRKTNLRICTQAENTRNRGMSAHNSSGFKGVTFNKGVKRWIACIRLNGKNKHLGCFDSPEDAARAYDMAAEKNYGQFARTNRTMRTICATG